MQLRNIGTALLERTHEVQERLHRPGHWLPHRNPSLSKPATSLADDPCMANTHSASIDDLAPKVLEAMDISKSDFRTPQSLAGQLGVTEAAVREALKQLEAGAKVRRPLGGEDVYPDWYRPTAAPPTRREKWWHLRALAGHIKPGC